MWSLTDHDEVSGQHGAAAAARAAGLDYLSGVEISVSFAGQTIHIVGLGIDPDDAALRNGLADTRAAAAGARARSATRWPRSASTARSTARRHWPATPRW